MTSATRRIADVYAALNVPQTTQLVTLQEEISKEFGLIPRSEFHVTLGFFGEISKQHINELGKAMCSSVSDDLQRLTLLGVGGAFDDSGEIEIIKEANKHLAKGKPRVLWVHVDRTDSLYQLRLALATKAKEIGLDASKVTPTYYPHITLGSAGPETEDYTLYDVHTVPKLNMYKNDLRIDSMKCDKVHITSVGCHPKSHYVLRSWI